jgi:hypothetical protein
MTIRAKSSASLGITKIARDLRGQQRLQLELRRREALLRSILDTVAEALVIIDGRGLIQSFSAAVGVGLALGALMMQTPAQAAATGLPRERDPSSRQSHIGLASFVSISSLIIWSQAKPTWQSAS